MSSKIKTDSEILNDRISHMFGIGPFERFQDYLNLMEAFLEKELENHNNSFDINEFEMDSKDAGEHHREYLSYLAGEYLQQKITLAFNFPHNLRSGLIIQVFSYLEFELKNICNYHSTLVQTNLSIDAAKSGSDMDKAKSYLKKIAKVKFNQLNPEWQFLNDIRKIRNFLVHHKGTILANDNDFNRIRKFSKNNELILREQTGRGLVKCYNLIIPNRKLPEKIILTARKLIDRVLKELNI